MTISPAATLFLACNEEKDVLVTFRSASDKEYGFQDWVRDRLAATGLSFVESERNKYPDLKLTGASVGFEVKSHAYPGRKTMDSNSQEPGGFHDGSEIYYVYGRYSRCGCDADGKPLGTLRDLVIYHGDFVDPSRKRYENLSVKGFGQFGDIMIRDRKMYVPKTAHAILSGLDHELTLVLPASVGELPGLSIVAPVVRREAARVLRRYTFDFDENTLEVETKHNPSAGTEHPFNVYRPEGHSGKSVKLIEVVEQLDFDAVADGTDMVDTDGR